jgi:hypothetical protein
MTGAEVDDEVTVKAAALLVALPAAFETITRYCSPLSALVVAGVVYVARVAPEMLTLFFCH